MMKHCQETSGLRNWDKRIERINATRRKITGCVAFVRDMPVIYLNLAARSQEVNRSEQVVAASNSKMAKEGIWLTIEPCNVCLDNRKEDDAQYYAEICFLPLN